MPTHVDDTPEDFEGTQSSDLTALDVSLLDAESVDEPWYASSSEASDDTVRTLLFTATNPAGTISVTVLMGGQILRVDLSDRLSMPESDLAAEITLIATLAQMRARAGQHVVIATLMRTRGHDPAFTASFLERTVRLPSPETVAAEERRVFAACYSSDDK